MQLRGVRRALLALSTAVPLTLTGCAAVGDKPGASASPEPSGESWVVVTTGKAKPSPSSSRGARTTSPESTVSPRPADPNCSATWPVGQVLIPVTVTSGSGSLAVTWPRNGSDSTYRVAAVPQDLLSGEQPPVVWQPVATTTGCTVSAVLTGLTAGKPYVVWLDAPGTGHLTDGSRNPYSGRSGVVYPG
jgi:hypothetical protein